MTRTKMYRPYYADISLASTVAVCSTNKNGILRGQSIIPTTWKPNQEQAWVNAKMCLQ